ncbi:MAG: ABC transporter substrate-binding protein, partial [Chloroflexota bacterium]
LVYRDPATLSFVPGLATSWTVSEDGLAYDFELREGVSFHDGTSLDAQAVAFNLDRIMTVGVGGRAQELLGTYSGYEIIGPRSIRLQLDEPYAGFLDALSQFYLGIASPTALQEFSVQRYQFYQVGTGPFRFVNFIPGNFVEIERFDGYAWPPVFYETEVELPVTHVRYVFYTDATERSNALLSGEADVMSRIPPSDARALAVNPQVQILPLTVPGQPYQLFLNTAQFPTDNVLVRQALLFATNRTELVNTALQGFSSPAYSPLTRATLFYSSGFDTAYAYNLLEARTLLESAGFGDEDNDGILDIDRVPLEVIVLILRDEITPELIDRLIPQWRDAGVRAQVVVAPTRASLLELIGEGDYNLVAVRTNGVEPGFLIDDFVALDTPSWTNAEIESLSTDLLVAYGALDVQARAGRYVAAQTTIMQEALLLPIADTVNLVGVSPQVQGLTYHADQITPILSNVSFTP